MAAAGRYLPKPDSSHTGTTSTTVRVRPGQLERYETPDPMRSDAVNVRFHGVRHWRHRPGGGLECLTRGTCAAREARGLVLARGGRYRCDRGRSPDGC